MTVRRWAHALALLLVTAGVAGCATVPESSPVQVLRQVSEGEDAQLPPGPADGSNPLDLVRDFVFASGSSNDSHGAARRFLAPAAAGWDDAASLTVLDGQFDTVPAPGAPDPSTGVTAIRVRGTAIGRVVSGSFEPRQAVFQQDVTVVRHDGQWRIASLPAGVVVPLSIFRDNYRPVRTWFADPARRLAVADLRYVPSVPARAQAARVVELLLAGPSDGLLGAAGSQLPPGAQLRSNVTAGTDGVLVVDLTGLGDLDEPARTLLAAQVVLSLSEVNVARVRLLADGEPLLPSRPVLTREDVASLHAEVQPAADVPGLVVAGGRVRRLTGPEPGLPLPGPVGNGEYVVESAASSSDGQRLAAVARAGDRWMLLVGGGPDGGVAPVPLTGASMTRPSWTPTGGEVWTVLDSRVVARVLVEGPAPVRTAQVNADELAALGPIADLRLSRDGMRVAAVVGGALYTGAVARSIDGEVAVRNIRRLRPDDLGEVVAADWRSAESIVAITRGPERLVGQVSVDGLGVQQVVGSNLTPPLRAVSAAANRPLLVSDQAGVWSFAGGDQTAWRQVLGGLPDAVPFYPG